MGKSKNKKKKSKNGNENNNDTSSSSLIMIDPLNIRFQHSRIRPYFSGCGRSVQGTLDDIRNGKIQPDELPPIQVLSSSDEDVYFSLNNRRLWVLKRCREEGLLSDNKIGVRIRHPKSSAEMERYTIENCALEAKFIREKKKTKKITEDDDDGSTTTSTTKNNTLDQKSSSSLLTEKEEDDDNVLLKSSSSRGDNNNNLSSSDNDDDDDSSDDEKDAYQNAFSALMM